LYKNFEKKFKKKLRRGGAKADHRVGVPSDRRSLFLSGEPFLERSKSFSL